VCIYYIKIKKKQPTSLYLESPKLRKEVDESLPCPFRMYSVWKFDGRSEKASARLIKNSLKFSRPFTKMIWRPKRVIRKTSPYFARISLTASLKFGIFVKFMVDPIIGHVGGPGGRFPGVLVRYNNKRTTTTNRINVTSTLSSKSIVILQGFQFFTLAIICEYTTKDLDLVSK
jgi:hypothetical protein